MSTPSAARIRYHHGDLHQALLAAGVELAREGGPDAVVLREATRRVGVSPNAAYRHFADRDALLNAVSSEAQAALARVIEEEFDLAPATDDAGSARARLRAIGTAYVRFARGNAGLFETAFGVPVNLNRSGDPQAAGPSGRTPFELLTMAIDEYVAAGIMPASRRPGAEFLAWSAVHGLAMLLIDGPLRSMPDSQKDAMTQQVVDMVDAGFTAP